jgi:hypothetical protein
MARLIMMLLLVPRGSTFNSGNSVDQNRPRSFRFSAVLNVDTCASVNEIYMFDFLIRKLLRTLVNFLIDLCLQKSPQSEMLPRMTTYFWHASDGLSLLQDAHQNALSIAIRSLHTTS